jgi:hypothetical protein
MLLLVLIGHCVVLNTNAALTQGYKQLFLINLDRRPDKLARMKYQLDSMNMSFERIPAVDGTLIRAAVTAKAPNLYHIVEPFVKLDIAQLASDDIDYGQVGCFCSHITTWQRAIDNVKRGIVSDGPIIIFEDDLTFDLAFPNHLQNDIIPTMPIGDVNWGIMGIGYCGDAVSKKPGLVLARVLVFFCTHAYMLRDISIAQRLMDAINTHEGVILDVGMANLMKRQDGYLTAFVYPGNNIVVQDRTLLSDITSSYNTMMPQVRNPIPIPDDMTMLMVAS